MCNPCLAAITLGFTLALPPLAPIQETTILERVEEKLQKNPALAKLMAQAPPELESTRFMAGRWDVVATTFATSRSARVVRTGTAESAFELDGRWLVTRTELPDQKVIQFLGYDPYERRWYLQFFSSAGRGTNAPLLSSAGWDAGRLVLAGTMMFYLEPAEVSVRFEKSGEDAYRLVFEESLPGRTSRALLQHEYRRRK